MSEFWKVTRGESLSNLCNFLQSNMPESGWRISAEEFCPKRSLDQNAIGHAWYREVSNTLKEDTPLNVKCYCKLHFGVPILRAENERYRKTYDASIKHLTYEQKLEAMTIWPVTSEMSVKQKSQYLEALQNHYRGRVNLEFPNYWAEYREAQIA